MEREKELRSELSFKDREMGMVAVKMECWQGYILWAVKREGCSHVCMNASLQELILLGVLLYKRIWLPLLCFLSSPIPFFFLLHSLIHLSSAIRQTRRTGSLDASPWAFIQASCLHNPKKKICALLKLPSVWYLWTKCTQIHSLPLTFCVGRRLVSMRLGQGSTHWYWLTRAGVWI